MTLRCPKCGWDGSRDGAWDVWFRYCEDVTLERRVEGVADGKLEVADDEPIEVVDEASARLRCGDCRHEFPVPVGVKVVSAP